MKYLTPLLISTLILSACSKNVTETIYVPYRAQERSSEKGAIKTSDIDLIKSLLKSDSPSIALAEFLARTLPKDEKEEMKQVIQKLSPAFVKSVLESMARDSDNIKRNLLFHDQKYQNNQDFIFETLLNPKNLNQGQYSSEEILKISVFTYLKNSALDEIIHTYKARSLTLIKEFASTIAVELSTSKEFEANFNKNSPDEFISKLLTYKPYIDKIDTYFKNSNLNDNEQYLVTVGAMVAGVMYSQVKEYKGFQNFIKSSKKTINDIKEINDKAKELKVLVSALEEHIIGAKKDVREISEGVSAMNRDLNFAYNEANEALKKPSKVHSKKMIAFLNDTVLNGKKETIENSSVFSRPVEINENLHKTLNATISMSNNLSKILNTTNEMCKVLGITLSKDALKAIDTANKVAAVVKIAGAAIQGFASGGVTGAFAALGATGVGGLTSAFGGQDNNAMEFALINKKLDQILDNQKLIMEMQVETMKMIKDLALMVDEYHQQEMLALAELRDNSLVSLELQRVSLNKEIRNCERIINFKLTSIWNDGKTRFNSNFGIYNVEMITSKFFSGIENLDDINKITNSAGSNTFAACQDGIAEAFGAELDSENPVLAIYMTNEDDRLYKWQRDTYAPLFEALVNFTGTNDFDTIPLHIPSANFRGLGYKKHYLSNPGKGLKSFSENYELENLISTKSLERYLSRYLVLYPILEFDKDIWSLSLEEIVTKHIKDSNRTSNFNTRSFYHLRNALKMVQTAIAQETLLAGEPLLPFLHQSHASEILEKVSCEENKFICMIKKNKLIMKNFIGFTLNIKFKNDEKFYYDYELAFNKKDLKSLAALLYPNLNENRLSITEDQVKLDQKYYLPTPDELVMEKIIYSENMDRLLKMQSLVTEALEKVVPVKRETRLEEQLSILMI